MKAAILAGGLGKRMMPYTKTIPKPMLPFGQSPILEHTIKWVRKSGIREIVLCTSHMHKVIEDYFGDGSKFGVRIEYAVTPKPMSTAGQLRAASHLLETAFVCAYGDSIFGHSLGAMIKAHGRTSAAITIATKKHTEVMPYGEIRAAQNGHVTAWVEKPKVQYMINVGCYVMEPGVLSLIPKNRAVGMDSTVKKAISRKMRVLHYPIRGGFLDVGNIYSYIAAHQGLASPPGRQDA